MLSGKRELGRCGAEMDDLGDVYFAVCKPKCRRRARGPRPDGMVYCRQARASGFLRLVRGDLRVILVTRHIRAAVNLHPRGVRCAYECTRR